ncbi:MAG: hypothetical protein ACR2ID_04035 [Chthoniobacterales bacterium]
MKQRSNPDSEANIRRIDSKPKAKKQTHGFQVHFLRGASAVTKMFSDTIHGGKENARRAARKFKRAAMANLPARLFSGIPNSAAKKARSRKSSGGAKKSSAGAKKKSSAGTKKTSAKSKSRR